MKRFVAVLVVVLLTVSMCSVRTFAEGKNDSSTINDAVDAQWSSSYNNSWASSDSSQRYYKINLTASGVVTIKASKQKQTAVDYYPIYVTVYDSSKQMIWNNRNTYDETDTGLYYYNKVGLTAGTYYVGVSPDAYLHASKINSTVSFTFASKTYYEFEPNNDAQHASSMTVGPTYQGDYGNGRGATFSNDYWKVDLEEGKKYKLAVSAAEISSNNTAITVYDPSGNDCQMSDTLKNNVSGNVHFVEFTAESTGTYIVSLTGFNGKQFSYNIYLDDITPANDQPGNDQPGNDQPGNDQPGNDQPGNDQPGNDQPGNDQPGNDQPGNDQPGNDQPGNDQPGNDQPGNDQPGNDQPGNDQPGNDQPGNDQPGNDQPGNDQPGNDQPGNDQPGNDQPGNDQPGNDQPGNDQPGNDQPGNDQPGNDQPGNDQPGNDQPGNDQPGNDQPGNDQQDDDKNKNNDSGKTENKNDGKNNNKTTDSSKKNNTTKNTNKSDNNKATDTGSNSTSNSGSTNNTSNGGSANKTTVKNDNRYSNEWINGKWYDQDGNQNYAGTLLWKSDATGWWVEDTDGWYPKDSWQKIDGTWYYFKPNGYMAMNEYYNGSWFNADGSWDSKYSLSWKSNASGWWVEDISGWWPSNTWLTIDGNWYYFDGSGYMVCNTYIDGYWIGADGICH